MSCLDVPKGVKCAVVYRCGLIGGLCCHHRLTSANNTHAIAFQPFPNPINENNHRSVAGALLDFNP